MKLTLCADSALGFWLTAHQRPSTSYSASIRSILRESSPKRSALNYASSRLPQLRPPLHSLTLTWGHPHPEGCIVHRCNQPLVSGSLLRIDHGLYATSPELCLLHAAKGSPLPRVALLGSCLCGVFRIDPGQRTGLSSRTPITSRRKIAQYLSRHQGRDSVKPLEQALPYIHDGAASPPESFLQLVLELPHRYGGFALSGCRTNYQVRPRHWAQRASERSYLVPDLCWPEEKLALEYDSTKIHTSAEQMSRDAQKRLALESEGYKVISVTAKQLASPQAMGFIAEEIYRRLGKRLRPRGAAFAERQQQLFALAGIVNEYLDPQWLRGECSFSNHSDGKYYPAGQNDAFCYPDPMTRVAKLVK